MAAFLAGSGFRITGPLTWGIGLLCAILALPVSATVDLTFSLWAAFEPGFWIVAVLAAGLYHGTVAVVLGRVYRHKPSDALMIGGAVLALHLILYFLWQSLRPLVLD